jgi:hypothetical protein
LENVTTVCINLVEKHWVLKWDLCHSF